MKDTGNTSEQAIEDKNFRYYDPRVNGLAFCDNDTPEAELNAKAPLPAIQHFLLTLCLCHDSLVVEETLEDRVFRMLDEDCDKVLSMKEMEASGLLTKELIGTSAAQVMAELDADRDGEVKYAEWP